MDIFNNNPLICAALAWVSAQLIKFIIVNIRERRINLLVLIQSGGMPSSHSATVCSLATAIGFQVGFGSPEFAIAAILAFIVMYDAAGVRRAAGEQARRINILTQDYLSDFEEDMQAQLKELLGHTPPEVFGGAILGILIPTILYNY
ncbi:MAG: divergent PAP2 family protein [Eubacteriales bacterium]|jgi:acid phosphatase family membrane protein YuiD